MAANAVPISATTIVGYSVTPPFSTADSYTFSFPYLSEDDFEIEVQSETVLEPDDYIFSSSYLIQLTTTGVNKLNSLYGSLTSVSMVIRRRTRINSKLVDFRDGSNLTEGDLDLLSDQLFYLIQEVYDTAELGNVQFNPVDGAIDLDGAELADVSEPTTGSSAATLSTVLNNVVTPDYTEGATYKEGRLVFNGGDLYRANTDVDDAPAVFDAGDWDLVLDASSLASISTIAADVVTAQAAADAAQADATQAIADAAAAQADADSAQTDATQVIADAAAAQADAAAAQADATQAIADAAAAQADADTANSDLASHEAENATAHIERDTEANLTTWASTATDGAIAFSTDTGKLFYVESSSLVELAAGSSNRYQTKILSSTTLTSTGDVAALSFTGLTLGKTYEVVGSGSLVTNSGGVGFNFRDAASGGGTVLHNVFLYDDDPSYSTIGNPSFAFKFIAQTTDLYFHVTSAAANRYIQGNGTRNQTYVQVTEVNDIETNEW